MASEQKKKDEQSKENFVVRTVKNSLIVRALSKFIEKIYEAAKSSVIGTILSSHDEVERARSESASGKAFTGGERALDRSKKVKNFMAKNIEQSALVGAAGKLHRFLMTVSLSSYGVMLFSFGFYSIVAYVISRFVIPSGRAGTAVLAAGIIAVPVSIFFFISKKSLSQAVVTSAFLKPVFFDLLGLRIGNTEKYAEEQPRRLVGIPFLVGMAIGVVTFFVNPLYIAAGVAVILLTALVFASPEAGLVIEFLVLPFAKTTYLAALTVMVAVSFVIKLICGRRSLKFTVIDIPVIMFMLMTLSGGLFSLGGGSLEKALVYVCFIFGYFLVKEMFRSERYVKRAMTALTISMAVVSLIGIAEYFVGSPSAIWQDASLFSSIKGRVVSTFDNPNVLGEYFVISIPISAALLSAAKTVRGRVASAMAVLIGLVCLVLTWSRGAWLGLLIAGGLALLFVSGKWAVASILVVPPAAAGLMFVNSNIISRFASIVNLSDSSTSYRIGIWKSTLRMLKDTFWFGIGTGSGAFEAVFPHYALSGITKAEHSHSLYLQIMTETGVFSLIIFLAIAFLLIQKGLSFSRSAVKPQNRFLTLGILAGIVGVLIQGVGDHIFYNYRICLLFWLAAGLLAAHVISAKESSVENESSY